MRDRGAVGIGAATTRCRFGRGASHEWRRRGTWSTESPPGTAGLPISYAASVSRDYRSTDPFGEFIRMWMPIRRGRVVSGDPRSVHNPQANMLTPMMTHPVLTHIHVDICCSLSLRVILAPYSDTSPRIQRAFTKKSAISSLCPYGSMGHASGQGYRRYSCCQRLYVCCCRAMFSTSSEATWSLRPEGAPPSLRYLSVSYTALIDA